MGRPVALWQTSGGKRLQPCGTTVGDSRCGSTPAAGSPAGRRGAAGGMLPSTHGIPSQAAQPRRSTAAAKPWVGVGPVWARSAVKFCIYLFFKQAG